MDALAQIGLHNPSKLTIKKCPSISEGTCVKEGDETQRLRDLRMLDGPQSAVK